MSPSWILLQVAIVAASVLGLLGAIKAVKELGTRFHWRAEVQRKAVHVCTGFYAMALPFLFQERWPVVLLIATSLAVMLAMRLPQVAKAGIGSALHGVERKSYGDMLLALAIGFIFLRSQGNLILYTLPIAVITLSDAAAALAGSTYGRRLFQVESGTKSVEGMAMFFLVTWIVVMVMLLLFTDVPRANVVVLGVTVAVFGAIVEADSWRGFDNLFVPILIHFYLMGHIASPPLDLLALGLAFLASVVLLMQFAPALRLTAHAARAYCVAVFMICGVSGALAAVLPIATVIAHIYARARHPCRSKYPDLDLLAMMAGTALVWLIVGETIGPSAINFFGIVFAGTLVVYTAVACRGYHLWVVLCAAGALAAHAGLTALSDPAKQWHGPLLPYAILTIALCAVVASLRPHWFDRWRAPRAALLATLIPLVAYIVSVRPWIS